MSNNITTLQLNQNNKANCCKKDIKQINVSVSTDNVVSTDEILEDGQYYEIIDGKVMINTVVNNIITEAVEATEEQIDSQEEVKKDLIEYKLLQLKELEDKEVKIETKNKVKSKTKKRKLKK